MKRLISLGIIFIFLISIIPMNAINATAAENVCCAKSGENYCVFTTQDKCIDSAEVKNKIGFISSSFSCSQLTDCKQVCCINPQGTCSEKVSKAQCRAQGGKPIDSPTCNIPECEKGACIISSQCQYPVTSAACKSQADALKIKSTFDPSIKSLNECNTKYSLEEGCCALSNQCSRTTGEQCTLQKGSFYPGKLCSNQELVSQCRDNTAQYAKTCSKDGNAYWTDSKGVLENVVGSANDGLIHNKKEEIQGKEGYCNFEQGFTCGKNKDGQYACIDINCKAGNIIDLTGIVQYKPFAGKMFPEQYTIKQEDLGGVQERKNGESWCITPPETGPERENKQSHYTFSCQLGKIRVEACGALGFRDKVCTQDIKDGKPSAKCIDNRWEDCWLYGGGGSFVNSQAFYPENRAESRYSDEKECLFLGGSLDPAKSHCKFDTEGDNECFPRYPPGFQFWKSATQDIASAQRLCKPRCGKGGNARTNSCDKDECLALGDCGNFKQGIPWWGGAGIGAVVGFFSGVGINNIFHVGAGGGWLGGAAPSAAVKPMGPAIELAVSQGATQAQAVAAGINAGATAGTSATQAELARAAASISGKYFASSGGLTFMGMVKQTAAMTLVGEAFTQLKQTAFKQVPQEQGQPQAYAFEDTSSGAVTRLSPGDEYTIEGKDFRTSEYTSSIIYDLKTNKAYDLRKNGAELTRETTFTGDNGKTYTYKGYDEGKKQQIITQVR